MIKQIFELFVLKPKEYSNTKINIRVGLNKHTHIHIRMKVISRNQPHAGL